ncbi:hydrolase 1, exosortase A system-associated [Paucibacter sp. O1-1]|nr:hydrolase 1, exosortase A system-associated [Paucibacter sp. O1-1]MDA3830658.1 hydrolase 1, exosortase A system-associated [Paucibacter sp. O1-1]
MSVREQALHFSCAGDALLGIVSSPAAPMASSGVGVLIVVGGPQYRAGSHRQFVLLARALSAQGHVCLRFDYRGMGDSAGAARDFEAVEADIGAAIAALRSHSPAVQRIVLWGLCDGASASLLYLRSRAAQADVHGLCLVNPWVRSVETLARARVKHYYRERLMQRSFWLKLLRGGVATEAVRGLLANLRQASAAPAATDGQEQLPFPKAMAQAWKSFDGPVLLLLSGKDLTAKEFIDTATTAPAWAGVLNGPNISREDLPQADHTFSEDTQRRQLEQICIDWLRSHALIAHARKRPS